MSGGFVGRWHQSELETLHIIQGPFDSCPNYILVGGFNTSEKYSSNWIIAPIFGVNIPNIFETTTQYSISPHLDFPKKFQGSHFSLPLCSYQNWRSVAEAIPWHLGDTPNLSMCRQISAASTWILGSCVFLEDFWGPLEDPWDWYVYL